MSWASHNPELYDQCCKRGLHWKIADKLKEYNHIFDQEHGYDECHRDEVIEAVIDVLYDQSELSTVLACWAAKDIGEAMGDLMSSIGDGLRLEAKETGQ